jgi:type VI secretion system protein ImpF
VAQNLVTQSLIDRLIDGENRGGNWPTERRAAERMYRESLRRDLEWLLNSRQPAIPALEDYPLAAASVINFGLQDVQSCNTSDVKGQSSLTAILLRAIRTFEPRIKDPRVYLVRSDNASRRWRFQIEGRISFENMQEEITFDTAYEPLRGEFEVK